MNHINKIVLGLFIIGISSATFAQEKSLKDLDFLIGTWEVREDIEAENWWEESTRVATFALDSAFIQIDAQAISSSGKERKYRWYIHYNFKKEQFEMTSMFSNWYKVQHDVLDWNAESRILTIRHEPDPNSKEYHERYGEWHFAEDMNSYTWKGENKYGDRDDPGIWRYVEKGKRVE